MGNLELGLHSKSIIKHSQIEFLKHLRIAGANLIPNS